MVAIIRLRQMFPSVQRSIVHGLPGLGFRTAPMPWEGPIILIEKFRLNVDLADAMGQFRDRPTLHQAATLSGVPGSGSKW